MVSNAVVEINVIEAYRIQKSSEEVDALKGTFDRAGTSSVSTRL